MLMLISPAKSLDFESNFFLKNQTLPKFQHRAEVLVNELRRYSQDELQKLMKISASLAALNKGRYLTWQSNSVSGNVKQALPSFTGEVYRGIDSSSFSSEDFDFAQDHLRILSGLYGILRPLDLIQPYRLEMGVKLAFAGFENLYQYWGNTISDAINEMSNSDDTIINLASNEYFKSVVHKRIKSKIVTPVFKDFNKGKLKVVAVYAKNARGQMVRYIVKNRINDVEQIKSFDINGYMFDANLSDDKKFVFVR